MLFAFNVFPLHFTRTIPFNSSLIAVVITSREYVGKFSLSNLLRSLAADIG
jgi:hypothetical protein